MLLLDDVLTLALHAHARLIATVANAMDLHSKLVAQSIVNLQYLRLEVQVEVVQRVSKLLLLPLSIVLIVSAGLDRIMVDMSAVSIIVVSLRPHVQDKVSLLVAALLLVVAWVVDLLRQTFSAYIGE